MTAERTPKRMRHTIEPDTIAWLEGQRKVTPTTSDGFRTISVSAYSPNSSPASESTTDLPEFCYSAQTLEMAGFSKAAAQEIFAQYESTAAKFAQLELELVTFLCDFIDGKADELDAYKPDDDYGAAWLSMGVDPDCVARLLRDEFRPIRLLMSASEELKESVRDTCNYVFGLSSKVKEQKRAEEMRNDSPGPSIVPRPAIPESRNISGSYPKVQTEVALPTQVEGHTILYKGGLMDRLELVWNNRETSSLSLSALASAPATDFDRRSDSITYFPKDLETAELYCSYKKNMRKLRLGIMHIAVPNEILEDSEFL
jgi:hypothetical protein